MKRRNSVSVLALQPAGSILTGHYWPDLSNILDSGTRAVVVIDAPAIRREVFLSVIEKAAAAGTRVVLYCRLEVSTVRSVVDASRIMPVETILQGTDDDIARFREVLRPGNDVSLAALMMQGLAPFFGFLPETVAREATRLFCGSRIPKSAEGFAELSGDPMQTARRSLRRAGLTTVSTLLWGARIARHHWRFADTQSRKDSRVDLEEFSDRAWSHAYTRMIGLAPRRAARDLEHEVIAERLLGALVNSSQ